ncbi:MAG: hypothetical protein ACRDD2_13380 [Sarcina sp.]
MGDFRELLKAYKESLGKEVIADTMEILEEINPKITLDSKKYKDGNKYIFKEIISYENSEKIINFISNYEIYNKNNLFAYKSELYKIISFIFEQGENPIEILMYSTKIIEDKIYKNAILDLLKDVIIEYKEEVIRAYKNILINWTWYEVIELVLTSIEQNLLIDLNDEIYYLFENNNFLREKTAEVLVNLSAEKYFESMINFLATVTTDSSEDIKLFRTIMYNLGRKTDRGSAYAYKIYLSINVRNQIVNGLILAIKLNMNRAIYENVLKKLQNPQIDKRVQKKLIMLLERTKESNSMSLDLLQRALKYNHLEQKSLQLAIGEDDISMQINIIKDKKIDEKIKVNSIIKLSRNKDKRIIEVLKSVYNDSDIIRIASAAVLVEKGESRELLTLFKYLFGSNNEEYEREAINQIRRLIASGNIEINNALIKVVEKFMENNDANGTERTLKIIDLYSMGKTNEKIGVVFLKKLKENHYLVIRDRLLKFFGKNYTVFSDKLREEIREEITRCSQIDEISKQAMEVLKIIRMGDIALPEYK